MQTFLPYASLLDSLNCLDYKRLGKQRVESFQILKCLLIEESRWKNHPAVKMWKGYESFLNIYYMLSINLWVNRGYNNTMNPYYFLSYLSNENIIPEWFGNEDFHNSHKSNLLRKLPEYYSKFNWNVPNNLEYVWPKGN